MQDLISTAQVRITPDLKTFLIHQSARQKLSVSDYIRKLILEAKNSQEA